METLRLNNPVVTTFRTVEEDNHPRFKKGDQLVILNNPVLRDKKQFTDPDCFRPERWAEPGLEESYYSLMFNQGPQRCPGKELAILLMETSLVEIYRKTGLNFCQSEPIVNVQKVQQMINPYSIKFKF